MINTQQHNLGFFTVGFIALVILSVICAGALDSLLVYAIPFIFLLGTWVVYQPKILYLFLFMALPFSTELELPGGFGLDFPTELILVLITAVSLLLGLSNAKKIGSNYFNHPISLLLIVQFAWITFTTITSTETIISLKYLLSKSWYIIPFYGFSFFVLKAKSDFIKHIGVLLIGVCLACLYVWFNHAQTGFSFKDINPSVYPIFRNHVNYACLILFTLPFLWLYIKESNSRFKGLLVGLGLYFVAAIIFSYTRAAIGAIFIGIAASYIFKWRLALPAILFSMGVAIFVTVHLISKNEFIQYAPDYNKTISHQKFDDLIDATAKGQDISTMERAYRWVAGYYMVKEKPIVGFGPGSFYSNYKEYAITAFKTYVSDNPEKSTIHNYYFLLLVEQGFIGLLLFLSICITAVLRGQYLYHQLSGFEKQLVMASLVCLIMVLTINVINDMVESIKTGSFFFLSLAFIVRADLHHKKRLYDAKLLERT
jgi:O-antigen ligase